MPIRVGGGPVPVLLDELARRGIELRAAGDRLRFRPRSAMTPDLAERFAAHKVELLASLSAADTSVDPTVPVARFTRQERQLLAGCPPRVLALVGAAKGAFARVGGLTVEAVRPHEGEIRRIASEDPGPSRRASEAANEATVHPTGSMAGESRSPPHIGRHAKDRTVRKDPQTFFHFEEST